VDAHELKRAVATVFGSGDGAVYVTLTDGALWATVPDVEAVGTASLSGTDGPQTYRGSQTSCSSSAPAGRVPDETLRVSTRDEFPFHVEAEHFAVTIVPRQFPEDGDEYDPTSGEVDVL